MWPSPRDTFRLLFIVACFIAITAWAASRAGNELGGFLARMLGGN